MTRKLLCVLALIAGSAPAFADHRGHYDRIDERQYRLERRIEEGRQSGELTRHEYRRLRHELHSIAREEHAYRADGHLSPREWHYLNSRLDALAHEVRFQRHDAQRRGPHYSGPYYNDQRADRRF